MGGMVCEGAMESGFIRDVQWDPHLCMPIIGSRIYRIAKHQSRKHFHPCSRECDMFSVLLCLENMGAWGNEAALGGGFTHSDGLFRDHSVPADMGEKTFHPESWIQHQSKGML